MGIVRIEKKVTKLTIFDAVLVFFPYFAENITVFEAEGDEAEISTEVKSAPLTPASLNIPNIRRGTAMSLRKSTPKSLVSLNMVLKSAFEIYVPRIIIARGVFILAM